jgi:hypothetical protein
LKSVVGRGGRGGRGGGERGEVERGGEGEVGKAVGRKGAS